MSTLTLDRSRITARVPVSVHETLETAAAMVGATFNHFVVQSALREAERVIEQERVVRLAGRDAQVFVKALEKPLPPNRKLAAALANYTKRRNDQTGTIDWAPRPKRV